MTARGWLGRDMYHKRQYRSGVWVEPKGLVVNPYPIGLLGKIRFPYKIAGTGLKDLKFYFFGRERNPYHITAFGFRPYPQFIAQYYSARGWAYQMRRTWHGMTATAMHPPDNDPPATPERLAGQVLLKEAVSIWQGMPAAVKDVYNKWRYPEKASGYNRFISWYLRTTIHMPIYWGTLQRSAIDVRSIEDKMVDQDVPTIRYPFNFRQYQLFNMVLHQGPGFPENPVKGQLFYRNDEDTIYKFDDPAWVEVGGGAGGGHTIQDEGISLPARTKLNFYGLGVAAGDDPGNTTTNVYIPKYADIDTRVATVIVAKDGSGDFTDLQTGINALPAGGGKVSVKNGTYELSDVITILTSNVLLEGQGDATIIHLADGINKNMIEVGNGADAISNVIIRDLMLSGNKANQNAGAGIYVRQYATNCDVKRVHVYDTYSYGIYAGLDADNVDISGNFLDQTGNYGIYLTSADYALIQANKFYRCSAQWGAALYGVELFKPRIIGNSIIDDRAAISASGIILTANMFSSYGTIEAVIIGNTINGCYDGIIYSPNTDSSYGWTVQANTIKGVYNNGIYNICMKSNIVGNVIKSPGSYGIFCGQSATNVYGNNILDSGKSGIYITTTGARIFNNIVDGCQWHGIWIENCNRNTVHGNYLTNIGLAAPSVFTAIYVTGGFASSGTENNIFDNTIILPTFGNRKAYSIREYGAYVDYNLIRGNRCRDAMLKEIQVTGVNSEAFDNQTIGP